MSEHHLQRVFSQWAGISPKRFLQFIRVIKKNGEIGNYRWGVERKTAMLAWERALLE